MISPECEDGECEYCELARCACECHDEDDSFDSDEFGEDPEAEFERRFLSER